MVIGLQVVLMIVGLVVYLLPLEPKVCELAKWVFIVALASWMGVIAR